MKESETKLAVRVQPNARRNQCIGFKEGVLQLKIAAPALKGKANLELTRYLAETLGLPKSSIIVDKGVTSKHKLVLVRGMVIEQVMARIRAAE